MSDTTKHMWVVGPNYFVATTRAVAERLAKQYLADEIGFSAEEAESAVASTPLKQCRDDLPLMIRQEDDQFVEHVVTKTCGEWATETDVGFFVSEEYGP